MKPGEAVPEDVRRQVLARDGDHCRICGRYDDQLALHHIDYRSQGGDNSVENLISLGWLPGRDCHLSVAHARKDLWQPILHALVQTPAITGMQILRQLAVGMDPLAFGLEEQVGISAAREYKRLVARRAEMRP